MRWTKHGTDGASRNPRRRGSEAEPNRQPQSLAGALLTALAASEDREQRADLRHRYAEAFPHGALDQAVVGQMVFVELARDLVADRGLDTATVSELAAAIAGMMTAGPAARALPGALHAALSDDPDAAMPELDPLDLVQLHSGFLAAAVPLLGLGLAGLSDRFAEAERRATANGVWLVRTDGTVAWDPADPISSRAPDVDDDSPAAAPLTATADAGPFRLTLPTGSDVRVLTKPDGTVAAVEVPQRRTTLQLTAFEARPDTTWDLVRRTIAEETARRGGTAHERPGPEGPELWTQSAGTATSDPATVRHLRYLARQPSGHLLRGVVMWSGPLDRGESAVLEQVFRLAQPAG